MRKKPSPLLKYLPRAKLAKVGKWQQFKNHPIAMPLALFTTLAVVSFAIFLALNGGQTKFKPISSYVVIISHDHHEQTVPTKERTVGALLAKLNIKLNTGDVVEPSSATPINQDDFRINIYRAVPVEIINGAQVTYTFSAATTPRAIVQQAGIAVYPEDDVSSNMTSDIVAANSIDTQVVINPATPINLNIYGTPTVIRTHATTVGQLLAEKKIVLGNGDSVQPAASTVLTPNGQVFLIHSGTQIETLQQTIPMPTQTIYDNTLAFGTSAIRQQGTAGSEVVTYQINTQNGVAVSQTAIQTVVTQQAVTEIVVEGTNLGGIKGDMALAGIAVSDYSYVDYIVSHESGWCLTKAQGEHSCPAVPDNAYTSNGYGLCQATPGYKMVSAGADWATNPITQLEWCNGYAQSRYGSWYGAYEHWLAYSNW